MPILGLVTWQSLQGTARLAEKFAIGVEYCHFDCAYTYQNESKSRDALQEKVEEGVVRQDNLFIVSKAGEEPFPADEDGMIVPSNRDFLDMWEAMEEQMDVEIVKAIEVSNFNCKQIDWLLRKPGLRHKPANNQVFDFELAKEEMEIVLAFKILHLCIKQVIPPTPGFSNIGVSLDIL